MQCFIFFFLYIHKSGHWAAGERDKEEKEKGKEKEKEKEKERKEIKRDRERERERERREVRKVFWLLMRAPSSLPALI